MCRVIHNALFFLSGSSGSFLWGQGTQTALCRDYQLRVNKEEIGRECWRERGREFPSQRGERKEKLGEQSPSKRRQPRGCRDDLAAESVTDSSRDWFPAPMAHGSQRLVTPVPRALTPSSGLHRYLRTHSIHYAHRHKRTRQWKQIFKN